MTLDRSRGNLHTPRCMNLVASRVTAHTEFRGGYRRLDFDAPAISREVRAGQFVHLRVPRLDGRVLRRPFSVFAADAGTISILYKCVGRGTETMRTGIRAGDEVSLLGPLGNGFPLELRGARPVLVAGGYGVAPLHLLASRLADRGTVFIGAAGAGDVLCDAEFAGMGWDVRTATEDGSLGAAGLVTVALDAWIAEKNTDAQVCCYACGPEEMLKAVADRAMERGWPAWLSFEKRLGCGVGACLACVQRIRREDGTEAWARVCTDGPVFEARTVVWR